MILSTLALLLFAGIEGAWEGKLTTPGGDLRLALVITKTPDGAYDGKMDSLDQGAFGLPLQEIKLDGKKVSFLLKMVNGSYEGTLNDSGTEISGQWKQGGIELPLVLKRVEKVEHPKRPQEPVAPYPYSATDVTVDNTGANVKLACTLTAPPSAGPHPAVVLITGSGPQDRDESLMGHKPFLILSDHLTRKGIAALRCDDRGIGKSTGDFAAATTADFSTDTVAEVEFLKTRKEIDAKRIGLIGHSEGALIAPMVANRNPSIAFIVLMAGPAVPGDQIILEQMKAIVQASGAPAAVLEPQIAMEKKVFEILRSEPNNEAAAKKLEEALPPGAAKEQAKRATSAWFRYFIDYDPAPALQKLKVPVLALFGEKDLQVLPAQNLAPMEAAFKKSGNPKTTVKVLPGLNHLFQPAKTGSPSEYGKTEETMAPLALDTISGWIRTQTGLEK